jgi:hypothetical protein
MKSILIRLIGACVLMTSVTILGLAGSASATDDPQEVQLTVVASSFDDISDDVSFHQETRLLINGATQVTWELSNHHIKVSKKEVRKAPRLRITDCAKGTSKYIWRKTDHAPVVVILPGSCLNNEGKLGHIRGGFDWHIKVPAVLKWDSSIKKYRHVFNFVNKKLSSKKCGNIIGGKVDVHLDKVKQVRYEADVKKSATAVVVSKTMAHVTFGFTCPNGAAFTVDASAYGYGSASGTVSFTERTRIAVANSAKLSLLSTSRGDAHLDATSAAGLLINVSAKCGTTVIVQPPTVTASARGCVDQGQTDGIVDVTGANPNNVAAPGSIVFDGRPAENVGSVAPGASVTRNFGLVGPGTYTVSFTLGAPVNKTATTQVTVLPCPDQSQPPTVSASANACVEQGQQSGVITVVVGNPNDADTANVTVGSQTKSTPVGAGSTASLTFSGYAPGNYAVVATLVNAKKSATTQVTVGKCVIAPPELRFNEVNQVLQGNSRSVTLEVKIPAGRQAKLHVNACNGGTISAATRDQTLTGTGDWMTVSVNYTAPGEVPPAGINPGCETPAGKDRLNGVLTDAADATLKGTNSVYFDIIEPNPDPL